MNVAFVKSFILMSLLAVQLATLPRLVRVFGHPNAVISSCILVTEAMKVLVCSFVYYRVNQRRFRTFWWKHIQLKTSFGTAAPAAVVYAAQNVAISHAQRHLDGITYNILNQTKLLSSAFMGYMILGRIQTRRQIFALFLLFAASVLAVSSNSQTSTKDSANDSFGLFTAIIGSCLSGVSGALSDLAMQKKSRDAFLFSAEISTYVFLTTVIGIIVDYIHNGPSSDLSRIHAAGGVLASAGIHSITSPALIPILSAAWGGILVGQVTKRVGSVRKGFAVCAGIVLTAIIEAGDRQNLHVVFSILIAIIAVVLHSTSHV